MRKKSKIYLHMFFSYLGILVIPMALAMVLYIYTFRVITGQAETMNENLLVMVKNEIDNEMDNIWKITSRLALDSKIQQTANVKGAYDANDQINLYHIYEEAQSINVSEAFIDDVFILFNNTQKVVSSRGNMTLEFFYNLYYKNDEFSYEDFRGYLGKFHYGDMIPLKLDSGKEVFLFTMGTLKSTFRESPAVVCCQISAETIKNRLQQMKWSDTMDVMLLTEQNVRVSANDMITGDTDWNYDQWEKGSHSQKNKVNEEYIVSVLPSEVLRWKYLSVLPMDQMKNNAEKVRTMTIVGLFVCILSGIFISYELTKKNYNPIKMLMDNFKNHGKVEIQEGENEYQWLNHQMDEFFRQHVDAEKLLKKNQKSLKNYYLYRLLQESSDGSASEQYGLRIHGDYNVVLLMTPVVKPGTDLENQEQKDRMEENALQKFAIMNVFEELCLNYFNINMVELGERVAAIVSLPGMETENLDILKNQAENLQQMMEEYLGFTVEILCGPVCAGWEGIHESYIQANRLEQYVHLLDTTLLFYDEVKDIQPEYNYPFELEQKMLNSIKVGNSEETWKTMEQMFDLNLKGKVTANLYCCLVYGLLGTVLEGARQGGYTEAAKEIRFTGGDISKMPVEKMKQRFHELLGEVCQKILEIQKETSKDQTMSKQIEDYIQKNFQDADLNISITSQHFDLTPAYLSSIYKKQTGGSLLNYILTVRITHAKEYLDQGYSVVEVASMTGFRDSGTFIRAFKKKMGVTPGQLKKEKPGK